MAPSSGVRDRAHAQQARRAVGATALGRDGHELAVLLDPRPARHQRITGERLGRRRVGEDGIDARVVGQKLDSGRGSGRNVARIDEPQAPVAGVGAAQARRQRVEGSGRDGDAVEALDGVEAFDQRDDPGGILAESSPPHLVIALGAPYPRDVVAVDERRAEALRLDAPPDEGVSRSRLQERLERRQCPPPSAAAG